MKELQKIATILSPIAKVYSEFSTCNKLKVGALIIKDGRIISTGTNGSPSKFPHCIDEGCLIENNHCVRTIHAELNALLFCSKHGISVHGCLMFSTDFPCFRCLMSIYTAGIGNIIFIRDYKDKYNYDFAIKLIDMNEIFFYKYIIDQNVLLPCNKQYFKGG